MKMMKDKVVKEIPENLIPTYTSMGWKEYKEPKKFSSTLTANENKEN